jgi:hypothetical protein
MELAGRIAAAAAAARNAVATAAPITAVAAAAAAVKTPSGFTKGSNPLWDLDDSMDEGSQ